MPNVPPKFFRHPVTLPQNPWPPTFQTNEKLQNFNVDGAAGAAAAATATTTTTTTTTRRRRLPMMFHHLPTKRKKNTIIRTSTQTGVALASRKRDRAPQRFWWRARRGLVVSVDWWCSRCSLQEKLHPGRLRAGSPKKITHEKEGKWSEPNLQGIVNPC